MNIGEYSIKKKTVTLVLTVLTVVAGIKAYDSLGRLEDPEFTIKQAIIATPYPGATAEEVEKEVTNEIEKAAQQLGQLKRIRDSVSTRGSSLVEVEIKDKYDKSTLPQVWDELRRKITEVQSSLPPGAGPSAVDDDFGDVYGVYVALHGDGYTFRELKDYADLLRRELLLVQDVKRIVFTGVQPEVIYVEMKRDRMASLGITQEQIFRALESKNLAADAGRAKVDTEFLTIDPTGAFASETQFRELLISEPGDARLIFLGDVAEIRRGYRDPPQGIVRSSAKVFFRDGELLRDAELETLDLDDPSLERRTLVGAPAIGLSISTVQGGNVVTMGEALAVRMKELMPLAPVGMEIDIISLQSASVTKSINGFLVNLIEAVAIVVVVLLLFMGFRSALLIGFILFLTICATFIVMKAWGVMLERISLGALIIALGMLVDNAIVVTDGMKMRIESGMDKLQAAREIVGQNQWPLLGATIVAVIAFAAIGLSTHQTGEYCRSLFQVIMISLMASWLTAVTVTPLLCVMLFKAKKEKPGAKKKDPYGSFVFRAYRGFLEFCIRIRYVTILVVAALFVAAVMGFGQLKDAFFPDSTRPQFMVDIWLPEGTYIRDTEAASARVEAFAMSMPNVLRVANHVGLPSSRFLLTYAPEKPNPAYAQLLVTVQDYALIDENRATVQAWMAENLPDAMCFTKRFKLGPGEGGNIQVRFSGPDAEKLRVLARRAMDVMHADGGAQSIRQSWRQRVKVIRPVLAEAQARRNGITRVDVSKRIAAAFQGEQVGVYREGTRDIEDRVIPILSRAPEEERQAIESIYDLPIYSPAAGRMIPLRQILLGFDTVYEDQLIRRRNRKRTVTVHCDQKTAEASLVWNRIAPAIEAIVPKAIAAGEISSEYEMQWGGEYEDSEDAVAALASSIPMFTVLMVLVVIILFNNLRQPLIIWLTVPLALIGVVAGLTAFDQPFNFMAILGSLSLAGMLIKNSIVLMDEINLNRFGREMEPYTAVVQAGVSRLRPVAMAAATTVLGMIPLLTDAFFVAMAIAVMFGLTFATVLTLVIVPTLYATLYRLKRPQPA
jgi:multidrug efflux pump subunit AcrB